MDTPFSLHEMRREIVKTGLTSPEKNQICYIMLGPQKDPKNPTSYRPIALTSHILTLMGRMIMDRITYYIESRRKLSPCQGGFRKGRGMMDPVACLETEIRKSQVKKEYVVAMFFDVETAYDMLLKERLMLKLQRMEMTGRAFNWINKKNLTDIQIRMGAAISTKYKIDIGTPKGSIIKLLLFSIIIDDIFLGIDIDISHYC